MMKLLFQKEYCAFLSCKKVHTANLSHHTISLSTREQTFEDFLLLFLLLENFLPIIYMI